MSEFGYTWVKTDKHVYGSIYREHKEDLMVFSTFSNPEPSHLSSQPQMMTEWGFKNADAPMIKSIVKWDHLDRVKTETAEYFIARVFHTEES